MSKDYLNTLTSNKALLSLGQTIMVNFLLNLYLLLNFDKFLIFKYVNWRKCEFVSGIVSRWNSNLCEWYTN